VFSPLWEKRGSESDARKNRAADGQDFPPAQCFLEHCLGLLGFQLAALALDLIR
jgi:hypothetical protein